LFYCSSGFEIGSINLSTKTCARVLVGIRYSKVILSLHVLLYLFLSLYICLSLVLYFCLICHSSSLSSLSVFLFYCSSGFEIGTINWSTKICACVLVRILSSKEIFMSISSSVFLSLCLSISSFLYCCHSLVMFYCCSWFEIGTKNQSTKTCACVLVRILSSKVILYVYMSFNLAVSVPVCLSLCPSFFESICLLFFYHFVILLWCSSALTDLTYVQR
jgi:hypothetical protein